MVALQIALDLLSIEDAVTIAEEAIKGGANWLEVGTPLIKNHGVAAIKKLKSLFPDRVIVADMKTMDTGDLEVEMAAKNGASVVCILALADDFTIKRAVNTAKAHDVKIMADLIGVKDKIKRAREVEKLGVNYILIHSPIDIQKVKAQRVDTSLAEIKKLRNAVKIPIAAAGGINLETAPLLRGAGVEIFIVGRAITKAKDVAATTRKLCEAIGMRVEEKKEKKPELKSLIEDFEKIPTPFISDAMKRFGAMRGLKPVVEGVRIAGKAYTVRTLGGDWGKVVKAVDMAEEGDIIVVDAQGVDIAVWGELATLSALKKGIKGVIIDGAVRDTDDIKKLEFPVWAKYITPNAGEPHGHGNLSVQINCCGIPVEPGDIVVADEVGVVVVPKKNAYEILQKAKEVAMKEKRYKEEIKKGKTLSEIFGL
jgi:3-hexulose-6-phosphate synthase/6-phospho-3-hexuloisomerase